MSAIFINRKKTCGREGVVSESVFHLSPGCGMLDWMAGEGAGRVGADPDVMMHRNIERRADDGTGEF